jgi:polynucleotide 5'-hydroxyl-kinase GRC3/NOL9
MNASEAAILTDAWTEAIAAARRHRRVLVLGATDMGKSTFIRAALEGSGGMLLDLDPGQKMIGPPGTIGLGRLDPPALQRFVFVGSTSSSTISRIARGAAELAAEAGPLVANTSGFVRGLGVRLQAATAAALRPDLVIEIGADVQAPAILPPNDIPLIRLERSPLARRKSAGARARLRQEAFAAALDGAERQTFQTSSLRFDPAPPAHLEGAARPVCALADPMGQDVGYGIVEEVGEEAIVILAPPLEAPVATVRLGRMWAERREQEWRLLETLRPSWRESG